MCRQVSAVAVWLATTWKPPAWMLPPSGTDFMLYNLRYANGKQRLALCQPTSVAPYLEGFKSSTGRIRNIYDSTHTGVFFSLIFLVSLPLGLQALNIFGISIHQIFMPYFSYCDNELNLMEFESSVCWAAASAIIKFKADKRFGNQIMRITRWGKKVTKLL